MNLALTHQEGFFFILRWLHVFFGIIWIGLLYYFNFVQGSFFAETDAPTKSNAIQKLVPRALWWFRWGAMFTFLTGWFYLAKRGPLVGFEAFASGWGVIILTGAVLGSLMWFNVWFIIWPNQKIVIASASAVAQGKPADPAAAGAGARATLASRTNVLFSIPMLFCMTGARHLPLQVSPDTGVMTYWIAAGILILILEFNAFKGKLGPMTTVRGVITSGFVLTAILYSMMEALT